jgi:uncharacterized protein YkwD
MAKSINYEEIVKEIVQQHNELRVNPQSYIPKLENSLKYYKENKIFAPPEEDPIKTTEGPEAVQEAINFLKNQKSLPKLILSEQICKACQDHIKDIGPKGMTGHEGRDGKNISERIEKYAEWDGDIAENLDFGFKKAENIMMNLLVDDGVKERYQRSNIFYPKFRYIGVGIGPHKDYGTCVCIGYSRNIRDLGSDLTNILDYINEYVDYRDKQNKKEAQNVYQEDDKDAPDDTVSLRIEKAHKKIEGNMHKITRKIYSLKSGAQCIVEVEDS